MRMPGSRLNFAGVKSRIESHRFRHASPTLSFASRIRNSRPSLAR